MKRSGALLLACLLACSGVGPPTYRVCVFDDNGARSFRIGTLVEVHMHEAEFGDDYSCSIIQLDDYPADGRHLLHRQTGASVRPCSAAGAWDIRNEDGRSDDGRTPDDTGPD